MLWPVGVGHRLGAELGGDDPDARHAVIVARGQGGQEGVGEVAVAAADAVVEPVVFMARLSEPATACSESVGMISGDIPGTPCCLGSGPSPPRR